MGECSWIFANCTTSETRTQWLARHSTRMTSIQDVTPEDDIPADDES